MRTTDHIRYNSAIIAEKRVTAAARQAVSLALKSESSSWHLAPIDDPRAIKSDLSDRLNSGDIGDLSRLIKV